MELKKRFEAIKRQFPETIILFKRGYKYACYEQDAKIVSMYIGTTPNIFSVEDMVSCEFDYRSLNKLQTLLRKIGFDVALNFELNNL